MILTLFDVTRLCSLRLFKLKINPTIGRIDLLKIISSNKNLKNTFIYPKTIQLYILYLIYVDCAKYTYAHIKNVSCKEYYNNIIVVVRKLGFYFSNVILLCSGYVLKSFIIKKLLKSVTENVLFYKYYLHIPRAPPWLGVVSFFFFPVQLIQVPVSCLVYYTGVIYIE